MRKLVFIFIVVLSVKAYSLLSTIDYGIFINAYVESTSRYNNTPKKTLNILTNSKQMCKSVKQL